MAQAKKASPTRPVRAIKSKATKATRPIRSTKSDTKNIKPRDPARIKKLLINVGIWVVVFFVSLVIVDYAVQYLNYNASIAIVNGERIYRKDFYARMEQIYGSSIAGQMIDQLLIEQEGEKQGITVTDEEVQAKIASWEESYGGKEAFDAELEARKLTREGLAKDVRISLIEEKILGADITITEEEEQQLYEQYKDVIVPNNPEPTFEEAKTRIDEALRQQKISALEQQWLEDLRAAANIKNNIDEPKPYSFLGITRALITELFN